MEIKSVLLNVKVQLHTIEGTLSNENILIYFACPSSLFQLLFMSFFFYSVFDVIIIVAN